MKQFFRALARRAAISALVSSGPLLFAPAVAQAQGVDEFGPYGTERTKRETPQNMAVELRFGPYRPSIDEEFEGSGRTPYKDHFGTDDRWLFGFEIDWELLQIEKFGSLGPGVGIGYTKMTGTTFLDDGTEADEKSTLRIIPMYLHGVLRVDTFAKNTPVPLVPYAKLGLGYAMWSMDDGIGIPKAPDGSKADDTSWGLQWALGGMLMLDVLNRQEANALDAMHGVNHSYVFLEWFRSDLDGFGSGDHMQVGTSTWMAGIALEM
jgi:hypothetical protein